MHLFNVFASIFIILFLNKMKQMKIKKNVKLTLLPGARHLILHILFLTHVHIGISRKNEILNPNITSLILATQHNFFFFPIHLIVIALRRSLTIIYTRFLNKHPIIFFADAIKFAPSHYDLAKNKFILLNQWPGGMLTNFRQIFRRNNHEYGHTSYTVIPRIPAAIISCSANLLPINDANSLGVFSLGLFEPQFRCIIPATVTLMINPSNSFLIFFLYLIKESYILAKINEKRLFKHSTKKSFLVNK